MSIALHAVIGEEQKEVIIASPQGSSGILHIMIGTYYHGDVVKTSEGWKVYPNVNSWLSYEDCEVIIESVKKNEV